MVRLRASLSLIFVLFAIMIASILREPRIPGAQSARTLHRKEDDLTILQHLCSLAIDSRDTGANKALVDRIQALAFAAASHHLNRTESSLRDLAKEDPAMLAKRVGDKGLCDLLTGRQILGGKVDSHTISELVSRIEGWTNRHPSPWQKTAIKSLLS